MRAGLRGPVGGTGLEVLGLSAVSHVVLVVDALADNAGLGGVCDGADRRAVRAAVALVQAQGVGDVRPGLGHLELPVLPAVNAGWAELHHRLNAGALGVVHEGLGGHAGDGLQAHAGHVGLALGHGAELAVVVLAVAGGDVDLHVLEVFNAQLRIVVDPVLGVGLAPHVRGGVSAGVGLRGGNGLRHAGGGGVQVAGEGANELEGPRVALR